MNMDKKTTQNTPTPNSISAYLPKLGGGFNDELVLSDYAISLEQLEPLRDLFKDEPSAEELCKMLTK